MDLNTLHKKLSREANYARAYEELGGSVELALHCRAIREERGITQQELAAETGVTAHAISRFEQLEEAQDGVVSAIVHALEPWLRRRGVQTEEWMQASPPPPYGELPSNAPFAVRGLAERPGVALPEDRTGVPKNGSV